MRILEIGSYIVPAYAGMVLAEQGHEVSKWTHGRDPVLDLRGGEDLWAWLNHGKEVVEADARMLEDMAEWALPDVIIDNLRPSAWERRGIDPENFARRRGLRWVSLRSEVGDTSFDILAQARSWMEHGPWVPFYVGDTTAGLWLAFKAIASRTPGHFVLGHASVLEKLVEGELTLPRPPGPTPWDPPGTYGLVNGEATVEYRGRSYREPVRDRAWKLAHLFHRDGRILI